MLFGPSKAGDRRTSAGPVQPRRSRKANVVSEIIIAILCLGRYLEYSAAGVYCISHKS